MATFFFWSWACRYNCLATIVSCSQNASATTHKSQLLVPLASHVSDSHIGVGKPAYLDEGEEVLKWRHDISNGDVEMVFDWLNRGRRTSLVPACIIQTMSVSRKYEAWKE